MAVEWLDAARYADTNGYQTDGERSMWRWRDWVIDAFNTNMPFDRFTIEQLAGDMLPNATLDQRIATGFNRNHSQNGEGGIVPAEFLTEYAVDRVDTTSTVWLGLTLGCARCHDHKFDPIRQKEFYEVLAHFNNIPERGKALKYVNSPPLVTAPTADQRAQLAKLDETLRVARDASPAFRRKRQPRRSDGSRRSPGPRASTGRCAIASWPDTRSTVIWRASVPGNRRAPSWKKGSHISSRPGGPRGQL
jgi:hypothetical protein